MDKGPKSKCRAYPLPPPALRFMGEDDANFLKIGDLCVWMLKQALPLPIISSLLDIGSGYGRLAHALLRNDEFSGIYYGFDILLKHVSWCQLELAPHGRYYFQHLDIHNARYNPTGRHRVQDIDFSSIPRVDVVTFYSVFTHLYEEDIRCYLHGAASLLKPKGKLLCTAFLRNAVSLAGEAEGKSRYPMPNRLNDHTYYYKEEDPLHAIGYDEEAFFDMFVENGLCVDQVIPGSWCGRSPASECDPFQDLVIASLPGAGQDG